jgi:hypothetical protein
MNHLIVNRIDLALDPVSLATLVVAIATLGRTIYFDRVRAVLKAIFRRPRSETTIIVDEGKHKYVFTAEKPDGEDRQEEP